ncbi:MAG TPA: efflux RND transporter periplasmic adaptor subunit [Anaerolineaceae bacterium]
MNRNWMNRLVSLALAALMLASTLSACTAVDQTGSLSASGTIAATHINITSELGGKVKEIAFKEGDTVKTGDVLFRLEDDVLQAQRKQAAASVDRAQKELDLAKVQQQSAQVQYDLALAGAQMGARQNRLEAWKAEKPDVFKQPGWYFVKSEEISAAEAEVKAARQALTVELDNLDQTLKKASNTQFASLETKLAQARAAYQVANQTNTLAGDAKNNEDLKKIAQDALDKAKADLDAIQKEYSATLSSTSARDVLEARARVAVAQSRLDNATDRYNLLLTGDESLQVKVAAAGLEQANRGVALTQAGLSEAQAGAKLLDLQIDKTAIKAPASGVLLSRSLEVGEIAAPGGVVMVIGRLEEVTLKVYVPEAQYGKIRLNQKVEVKVDSFPGKTYSGVVTNISNQAEFTPRNVQTADGRKATVYAIKIVIPNPTGDLKPGMPADVNFVF